MRTALTVGFALMVVVGSAAQSRPGKPPRQAPPVDHSVFDAILRESVRDERVDYLTIRRTQWRQLRAYLDQLARVAVEPLGRDEQLAYYINLYNATMVDAVLRRFKAGYSPAQDDFSVFRAPLVRLKGHRLSLNELENKIIRPTFKESRIHAALVCAARSCPPLLPRAYRAADLDSVLERNMRRFVNDSRRNRIDAEHKQLHLSRIFDWYAGDFGGRAALPAYLSKYTDADLSGFGSEFLEYSWDLNIAPPRDGQWVATTIDEAELWAEPGGDTQIGSAALGEVFRELARKGEWIRIQRPFDGGEAWVVQGAVEPFVVNAH